VPRSSSPASARCRGLAHGGRLSAAAIASLPGAPVVRDFVPQRAVLQQASVLITNGGLNTVLDAAAAGVPMLVVPIAFEQGAIAARVAHAGVGAVLPPRRLSLDRLRALVPALLGDAALRARARALGIAMAGYGGAVAAADLVEAAIGAGKRSISPDRVALAVPA
jgi:zeaxanthin glucosyltransferase